MKLHSFSLLALTILMLSACTNSGSNSTLAISGKSQCGVSPVSGIVGGQVLDGSSDLSHHIVMLLLKTDVGSESCTGTLISPDVILTAAHCAEKVVKDPAGTMRVVFSAQPECERDTHQEMHVGTPEVVSIPQEWYTSNGTSGDLALIKLKAPAPSGYSPLPLSQGFGDLSDAQAVIVAGYGNTVAATEGADAAPVALRSTKVYSLDSDMRNELVKLQKKKDPTFDVLSEEIVNSDQFSTLIFDQSKGHGICSGDSGGPALLTVNGHIEIIGVASSVTNPKAGKASCDYIGMHTNTVFYNAWIAAALNDLDSN